MSSDFNREEHIHARKNFYANIASFWPDLHDTEYALYDIVCFSKDDIKDIRLATNRIGNLFFKTAKLLRHSDDDTLRGIDIPEAAIPFIREISLPVETVISRVDLVKTNKGLKVLELNADTPTFEKEVFSVNRKVAQHFGLEDPNDGYESQLGNAIDKAIIESHIRTNQIHDPYVVFTSHDDHPEDRLTTLYLMSLSRLPVSYQPLHSLQIVQNEGLFDENGRRIDVLYRQTYPMEHLVEDLDPVSNEKVGLQLLELVALKKLSIVNPISAFLLQSKAVQAIIWGMMELEHPYFTEQEREWIRTYFLPTYLESDPFIKQGIQYVKKPSFGREGDTVEIFNSVGQKIEEDTYKTYQSSLPVFQQYVDLPSYSIKTAEGLKEGKLLIGSFLVNGKASGIGIRAGKQITDNNAYFLPVGMK
ncbi:glutathionylspermidine synthase family protein [Bacillus luteolus]|uniref:Glutathionylspermidine synthase family protein n=1 Tax=Litchfieldia luteola TaxID=682179 RepID=A0ABR9QMR2_9BACI|nr:glutathionylspermidine synthase family protein [Cytobacillus luteolus]MBE4909782.1 glutathionylspermidine synthase family protein [Cytobacillus luteolus]MBP1942675.1 glutathionylspermidine synthase [Cytobacillus luteolus]